jgi:hypothetical protein
VKTLLILVIFFHKNVSFDATLSGVFKFHIQFLV